MVVPINTLRLTSEIQWVRLQDYCKEVSQLSVLPFDGLPECNVKGRNQCINLDWSRESIIIRSVTRKLFKHCSGKHLKHVLLVTFGGERREGKFQFKTYIHKLPPVEKTILSENFISKNFMDY